jgi:hypothetical protein
MWTFWPVVVISFIAAFSIGHKQVRLGCSDADPSRHLVCRTSEVNGKPTDLATVRTTGAGALDRTVVRGAAIEDFSWNEPGEGEHPFSIGIVEYDDQGLAWSDKQIDRVRDLVRTTVADDDALIVAFVHGWKNNCETCNGNLTCFREVLALLAATEANLAKVTGTTPRKVVGIYVAWRGRTIRIKQADVLSAFSRKATADRVGGRTSDLTAFLAWLNQTRLRANGAGSRPAHQSPYGTRLVLVGHSFGADVLFGAIAGHLNAQLGASAALGTALHAEPFANVTVLVNPALEASLYDRFNKDARVAFKDRQLPLLVTVQATNDVVTHHVFPIERAIVSVGNSTASEHGYESSLSAVGHFSDYFTHQLIEPEAAKKARRNAPVPRTACGCDNLVASRTAHARLLESIREALHQSPSAHIGGPMKALLSDFEPINANTNVDSPLMLVRASPDVVNGHGGIYQQAFFDFLANFVIREQMFESVEIERLMRRAFQGGAADQSRQ